VQSQQVGVLRSNCADSLDRTNVVQSLFGRKAAEATLRSLLFLDRDQGIETAFPEVSCPYSMLSFFAISSFLILSFSAFILSFSALNLSLLDCYRAHKRAVFSMSV
jgi:hypothetical protein